MRAYYPSHALPSVVIGILAHGGVPAEGEDMTAIETGRRFDIEELRGPVHALSIQARAPAE